MRRRINKHHFLFLFLLFVVFNLLLPVEKGIEVPEMGERVTEDVIAPFGFSIYKSGEKLEKEKEVKALSVPPVIRGIELPNKKELLRELDSLLKVIPGSSIAKLEVSRKKSRLKKLFSEVLDRGVISDKSILPASIDNEYIIVMQDTVFKKQIKDFFDKDEAVNYFSENISNILNVPTEEQQNIVKLFSSYLKANLIVDFAETERRRSKARESVQDSIGYVEEGEKIINAGEIVDRGTYRKLQSMRMKQEMKYSSALIPRLGRNQLYFILISVFIFIFLMVRENEIYSKPRYLYLFVINMILLLALYRFLPMYLVPMASFVMFFTLAVDLDIGILFAISSTVIIALYQDFTIPEVVPVLTGSLAGGLLLVDSKNRADWYRTGILVAITTGLLAVAVELYQISAIGELMASLGYGITNGFLSVLILFGLLFLYERVFNITTNFTWMEYADLNNELLKKLSRLAPGTYQHSLMVSALAENAAEAINANSLLSRVASLYHDVGKLRRPGYFAENFRDGSNPHNDIPPKLSAIIVRTHISDGVQIAKEHNLPGEIIDIIKEHQGTGLIVPFYDKARRYSDNVNEEDFSYGGPLPVSKEACIVMLADAIEATSRSMEEPTEQEIKDMIKKTIRKNFLNGQFDSSELTVQELRVISEEFFRSLIGRYHQRPTYPEGE